MATTQYRDQTVTTVREPPAVGDPLIAFTLTLPDLADYSSDDLAGQRVVLNVFPSVDTRVCALSVRRFNELAAGLDGVSVLCVSRDLPFALGRFCGAEGIENVTVSSDFRTDFGDVYGVTMAEQGVSQLVSVDLARAELLVAAQ